MIKLEEMVISNLLIVCGIVLSTGWLILCVQSNSIIGIFFNIILMLLCVFLSVYNSVLDYQRTVLRDRLITNLEFLVEKLEYRVQDLTEENESLENQLEFADYGDDL